VRRPASDFGSERGLGCLGVRARATGFRGIRPRLTASERAALSVHSERGSSWGAGEQHLAHAGEPDEPYCAGGGTARIVPRSRLALLLGHQHQTGQQDRREGKRRLLPDRRERARCLPPRTCRRRTRTGSRRAWALRPAPSQARNAATAGIDEDGSWCSAMRWPPSLPEPTQRQETSLPQPPPRPRAGSSNRSRRRIGRCRSARSGCDPRFANAVGARVQRHNPVTEAEQIPWPRYAPDARTKDLQNRAREGPSSRGSALTCQARGLSPPV